MNQDDKLLAEFARVDRVVAEKFTQVDDKAVIRFAKTIHRAGIELGDEKYGYPATMLKRLFHIAGEPVPADIPADDYKEVQCHVVEVTKLIDRATLKLGN